MRKFRGDRHALVVDRYTAGVSVMLSRRDIMRYGLIVAATAGLPSLAAGLAQLRARLWVVENRLSGARSVARTLDSSGAEWHGYSTDPGRVWMDVIEPTLKAGPVRIGGYTSAPVLFCLHYLARCHGVELEAVARGITTPKDIAFEQQALIDLRDPRFSDRTAAFTWLLAPRRA